MKGCCSKVEGCKTPLWVFFMLFFNCTYGTKTNEASQTEALNDILQGFFCDFRENMHFFRKNVLF